mgnify:CR=1 FL=1
MKASEYAKYYFDLREKSTEGKFESVKQLTQEEAEKLEANSLGLQNKSKSSLKRTTSSDSLKTKSKPVILNWKGEVHWSEDDDLFEQK